uniref:Uncharacterized protein n=1 Tax=Strigamia maritima TaxID=126957 RepID=T1IHG1_STRMM
MMSSNDIDKLEVMILFESKVHPNCLLSARKAFTPELKNINKLNFEKKRNSVNTWNSSWNPLTRPCKDAQTDDASPAYADTNMSAEQSNERLSNCTKKLDDKNLNEKFLLFINENITVSKKVMLKMMMLTFSITYQQVFQECHCGANVATRGAPSYQSTFFLPIPSILPVTRGRVSAYSARKLNKRGNYTAHSNPRDTSCVGSVGGGDDQDFVYWMLLQINFDQIQNFATRTLKFPNIRIPIFSLSAGSPDTETESGYPTSCSDNLRLGILGCEIFKRTTQNLSPFQQLLSEMVPFLRTKDMRGEPLSPKESPHCTILKPFCFIYLYVKGDNGKRICGGLHKANGVSIGFCGLLCNALTS